MFSTCAFVTLLQHPASPVRQLIVGDLSRRMVYGLAMGATAIGIVMVWADATKLRKSILRVLRLTDKEQIRLRLDDHTQPFAKNRVVIDQQYPYGFRWWHIALPIKPSYVSQSNDGKRLYRTLNHLRDRIWSHHGQQTALLEIELSLLEFAVSITRSVHTIEVSVVRDRISPSVS